MTHNTVEISKEKDVLLNKIGYWSILKDKDEKEKELISNYLLPLSHILKETGKNFYICTCGYTRYDTRNTLCFVCNKVSKEYTYFNEKNLSPFAYNEKVLITDTLFNKNKAKSIRYLEGKLKLLFDEDTQKVDLDLSEVKESSIIIYFDKNNQFKIFLNDEEVTLLYLLTLFKDNSTLLLDVLVKQIMLLDNNKLKFINKQKEVNKTINVLQKKIKDMESLGMRDKSYSYSKISDLRSKLSNTKVDFKFYITYQLIKEEFLDLCDNDILSVLKEFSFIKNKGRIDYNDDDFSYHFMKFIKVFLKTKTSRSYTFEEFFGFDKSLKDLLLLLSFDAKQMKSIYNLKEKEKNNLIYFLDNKEKLEQFNLSQESIYTLILLFKKYAFDIDELINYIEHIAEHEGMDYYEVIYYYGVYVKKSKVSEFKKLPYPVNLKLTARTGVK